ncbi:alanyl-tRNA editing protein [Mesoterricola silvestris]|uniref:Alanyl-tRNA editing protein n=1 Tax=Mesoterricola silvestris TaxID=2927979 RepID=A0AA48H552_9BACT|nr:alanyl-tRNA editing protein [Mesoterricola silvestris]BDU72048.1 alanyl-tRNA editing protein [Mesoterricola silvestris]
MSDLAAYERDPYLTELDTAVVRAGDDGRPFAVLADTVLYPEGGGQPPDHGSLGAAEVLDVQKRDGEVRHYLSAPVAPGPARVRLDWDRRFDHMQQHTGQHLLTAVAQDRFAWATTAFHLGEEVCDIELATPAIRGAELRALEEAVAAEIRAARPVSAARVKPGDLAGLQVRSRGLPEGFTGDVRLVTIQGVDTNTCGGTHVRSTAELEAVALLGTEGLRGGTRLFFVAGGRARRRLAAHETRNAALRTLLGAPDAGLVPALEGRLEQMRALDRRVRALEEDLAGLVVEALASRPGPVADHHFEGRDAGFLQRAARQLAAAAPHKAVFFTSTLEGQHFFLLTAGEASALDVPARGRELAALLGGRGGGSGRLFQGKASTLEARGAAAALLS